MEKANLLKKKRLIFVCISLALLVVTVILAVISFKLVAKSNYSLMWYFFGASIFTLYLATYIGVMAVNFNLYYKVVSAVIREETTDEARLEGALNIKAKSLAKIIKKCKKRGYIA